MSIPSLPPETQVFLDALAQGLSVAGAARAAGVSRSTAYRWRADRAFGKAWSEAVDAGTDRLEDEALRRAMDGVEKPVYRNGQLVGQVRDMSDTLLMALLTARRPEKFRATHKADQPGRSDAARESARASLERKLARLDRRTRTPPLPEGTDGSGSGSSSA